MEPSETLQLFWESTGSHVPTQPAAEREVRALEVHYGITLPSDFRDYLLCSSPVDDNAYDHNFCLWWPLHKIKNIPDEYDHELGNPAVARDAARYLFFADHSLWAWAWAIACGEDENQGRIAVVGASNRFVADDFGSFVASYVRDWNSVF